MRRKVAPVARHVTWIRVADASQFQVWNPPCEVHISTRRVRYVPYRAPAAGRLPGGGITAFEGDCPAHAGAWTGAPTLGVEQAVSPASALAREILELADPRGEQRRCRQATRRPVPPRPRRGRRDLLPRRHRRRARRDRAR